MVNVLTVEGALQNVSDAERNEICRLVLHTQSKARIEMCENPDTKEAWVRATPPDEAAAERRARRRQFRKCR